MKPDRCPTCHRELEKELGEMRKNAERYLWIRLASVDVAISNSFVAICESEPATPELFDAAIDDAMDAEILQRGGG